MNNINEELLNIIIEKIIKEYKDDVSLVCVYGPYLDEIDSGNSDIKLYLVPKTNKAYDLCSSFIIQGKGYDIYAMTYERLEKIANFDEDSVPLIDEAKIIYAASEEDILKFNEFKERIKKTKASIISLDLMEKADDHLNKAMSYYYKCIIESEIGEIRRISGEILNILSNCIAIMNNTYIKNGIENQLAEVKQLLYVPLGFEKMYDNIIVSNNVDEIKEKLFDIIKSTRVLYGKLLNKALYKKDPKKVLSGVYEELVSTWNKIYAACDKGDYRLAFLAGSYLQNQINKTNVECEFDKVDFMKFFNKDDLKGFKLEIMRAEKGFLDNLNSNSVEIKVYDTMDEFVQSNMK